MRKLLLTLLFICAVVLFPVTASAQTRLMGIATVGTESGLGYKLPFISLGGGIEQGLGKRFEIDSSAGFSPTNKSVAGFTYSHQVNASVVGTVWLQSHVGVTFGEQYTHQKTNLYTKHGHGWKTGLVFRETWGGYPGRIMLTYIPPDGGYDPKTGIESDRLTGGRVGWETQLYSYFRLGTSLGFYHGYTQGNPVCDGTFSQAVPTCPRGSYATGDAIVYFRFTTKTSIDQLY